MSALNRWLSQCRDGEEGEDPRKHEQESVERQRAEECFIYAEIQMGEMDWHWKKFVKAFCKDMKCLFCPKWISLQRDVLI